MATYHHELRPLTDCLEDGSWLEMISKMSPGGGKALAGPAEGPLQDGLGASLAVGKQACDWKLYLVQVGPAAQHYNLMAGLDCSR